MKERRRKEEGKFNVVRGRRKVRKRKRGRLREYVKEWSERG